MGGFAWVTLATNDSYSLGALVLAHSLKAVGTAHQLAVLVTPGVTNAMREKLSAVFNLVEEVNILDSRDEANLRLLKRPELGITFTKLHCWRLTQFEKCVFLDADTLVLQHCDELFDREELSAAPDVGWPDCFNSGVFVYRPSLETYDKLIQFALEKGSFDGGDQGLLNLYFSDWAHKDISRHLPFIYNMCSTACYSYLPAFKQFGANAKIIHFIGAQKPWLQYFNTETRKVQPSGDSSHLQEVLQKWWDIFCSLIHPQLSPAMHRQLQHAVSPSYFPPQYAPPPNPTSSADDYENAWDPWDEYDQKNVQDPHYTSVSTHYIQNQPIESLNTNASHVTDQPTIHSQPQSYNYYTNSAQNNSFYQPISQPVYQHVPRVPTPPPSPQPQLQHHVPQYQHTQTQDHVSEPQYHHDEPQNHSQPQFHHQEHHHHLKSQHHQEHTHQITHAHPHQEHTHQNQSSHDRQSHNEHFKHKNNHPHTNHPPEQSYHQNDHLHSHQNKAESVSPNPEHPTSPNRLDPVPILPKECEATTTVSNDITLSSTIEDCIKQDDAGLAGAFAQLTLGVPRTPEQDAFENVLRKQAWEVGNIDYLGRDSFDNIWSKISATLSGLSAPESAEPAVEPEPTAPAQSQSESAPTQAEVEPPLDTTTSAPTIEASIDQQQSPLADTSTLQEVVEPKKSEPSVAESPKASEVVKEEESSQPQPLPEIPDSPKEPSELPIAETKPAEIQAEVAATDANVQELKTDISDTKTATLSEPQEAVTEKSEISSEVEACPLPQKKEVEKAAEPEVAKETEAVVESVCSLPAKKEGPKETETQVVVAPKPEQKQPEALPLQTETKETIPAQKVALPSQESPKETPQVQELPAQPSPVATKEPETASKPQPTVPQLPEVSPQPTAPQLPEVPPQPEVVQEPAALPKKSEASAPSATIPKKVVKPMPKETPVASEATAAPASSKETTKAASSKDSPKTKVTAATPPVTPGSPLVEKTKEALAAEASIPDTPPPTEEGSTPTPPPRKTDKPKKVAAKPKK